MGCTILKGTFRDGLYHLEDTAAVKDLVQVKFNSQIQKFVKKNNKGFIAFDDTHYFY